MSFIQAGFLIACAAVAIPVLIHLLSRWQVRVIELGTMRYLQEVVRDGAQRRKIRRWLLLLTRMSLALLLALLFARPFLNERIRRDGDRLRIVLLDRSSSMGMPGQNGRLIDDAVGAATDAAGELGSDARVLWAWFDSHVQPLDEQTVRPSAPAVVEGDTNYRAALAWARDRIDAHPDAIADVVVVTDMQQSGLSLRQREDDRLQFPREVPVRVIDVGRPAANNLAITGVNASAVQLPTDRSSIIEVTLFNHGTLPFEEVPLTVTAADGGRSARQKKSLSVPAGQAAEIQFELGKLDPGSWQVTVAMDVEDDLAADNRRLTAFEIREPTDVLVFDSGSRDDGPAAESYFLVTALEHADKYSLHERPGADSSSPRNRFQADVVYLAEQGIGTLDPTRHPLTVVSDAAALPPSVVERLDAYVHDGGRLLVFAGDGAGSDLPGVWQQSALAPGHLEPPQRSGAMPFRIVTVSGRGAMLKPFEDPQHGDLSRLAFQKMLPVQERDSTEVLARFDHGRPALTHHRHGEGRIVWFMSSADAAWGRWTMSPLYLPLVQQMAADLLGLTGEGPVRFRLLGDPLPDGAGPEPSDAGAASHGSAPQPTLIGGTLFSQSGFVERPDALYVVNGPAKESDPTRITPEAFADQLAVTLATGAGPAVGTPVEGDQRREMWPWFAAAAFVLCIGEFALANRTPA